MERRRAPEREDRDEAKHSKPLKQVEVEWTSDLTPLNSQFMKTYEISMKSIFNLI